jgi:hypothetical protein
VQLFFLPHLNQQTLSLPAVGQLWWPAGHMPRMMCTHQAPLAPPAAEEAGGGSRYAACRTLHARPSMQQGRAVRCVRLLRTRGVLCIRSAGDAHAAHCTCTAGAMRAGAEPLPAARGVRRACARAVRVSSLCVCPRLRKRAAVCVCVCRCMCQLLSAGQDVTMSARRSSSSSSCHRARGCCGGNGCALGPAAR